MSAYELSRRSVLRGLGLTAVAAGAGFAVARRSDAAKARPAASAANAYGAPAAQQGKPLAALDTVPAGGGVIVDSIVLTRDGKGNVRGFSATCTHQGCPVNAVKNGTIQCPCHGSRFNAATGAPVEGPATRPLAQVSVVVRDGNVYTD